LSLKAPHYLGHNPLGAVMVIVLLLSIAMVSLTGMIIVANEGQGPLAGTIFSTMPVSLVMDVHEIIANFTLLMVVVHVSGVLMSSVLEGENLIKSMVTGRKKYRPYWEDVKAGKERGHQS
jgi:cytochrome b